MPHRFICKKIQINLKKIILRFFVLCILFLLASEAESSSTKHILILNSYHKGLFWSDQLIEGIVSIFRDKCVFDYEFHYEFMDTKKTFDEKHYSNLYQLYKHKFAGRKLDLIISCDDNALNFILKYHESLFGNVPVIFCGVNNYDPSIINGQRNITGLIGNYDIKSTVDIALKLHPDRKSIVVINDYTTTGKAFRKIIDSIIKEYPEDITFSFTDNIDIKDVIEQVKSLKDDSFGLLLSFLKDKSGNTFSFSESVTLICANSRVPVYGFWDYYVGKGIVGGLINSPFIHGENTGQIAIDLLSKKKDIKDIPIKVQKLNQFKFDYTQLEKWKIDVDDLPDKSLIINRPFRFYRRHKKVMFSILFFLLLQSAIILILVINIGIRKKTENERQQLIKEIAAKNEELRSIMFIASHDLRSPLANIQGFSCELENGCQQFKIFLTKQEKKFKDNQIDEYKDVFNFVEDMPDFFKYLNAGIRKLNDLLNSLSRVSRVGSVDIKIEQIDMNKLCGNVIDEAHFQVQQSKAVINVDLLPSCFGDTKLLNLVITNLLINAVNYLDKSRPGIINITGYIEDQASVYCIEDNGIGILEDHQDKIFDLFYRLNPEISDGEGIGLTIVKRILNRLNGTVWFDSKIGSGTKCYVSLPYYLKKE